MTKKVNRTHFASVLAGASLVLCAAASQMSRPQVIAPPPDIDDRTIVLFDGTNFDAWRNRDGGDCTWEIQSDGSALVRGGDAVTHRVFGDFQLHVEFFLPPTPDKEGQARSNSGVYLQGRYEIQVLDSFGDKPELNGCGAIYSIATPLVNASKPAGEWQTYDIAFRAYQGGLEGSGEPARVTVFHNGVLIHNNLELPKTTPGGIDALAAASQGQILLQDHGDPVRYRNIWIRR